jgi:FixJ family two-component response regulator
MEPALPDLPNDNDPLVLVIDDDPDVREGLRAFFESVNLQTKVYGSALEFVSEWPERVRCLVLDVRLPGLSGVDFQTRLAALQIDIPIIFITGHGDVPMSVKTMKAGAVDFLTKPLREQELLDAVRVGLDRDRKRREHDNMTRNLHVRFAALSSRERQVMTLVAAGLMNKQVAAELGISEVTVKVHRHHITKKLGAKSFPEPGENGQNCWVTSPHPFTSRKKIGVREETPVPSGSTRASQAACSNQRGAEVERPHRGTDFLPFLPRRASRAL